MTHRKYLISIIVVVSSPNIARVDAGLPRGPNEQVTAADQGGCQNCKTRASCPEPRVGGWWLLQPSFLDESGVQQQNCELNIDE
jgi:hypothetical protein